MQLVKNWGEKKEERRRRKKKKRRKKRRRTRERKRREDPFGETRAHTRRRRKAEREREREKERERERKREREKDTFFHLHVDALCLIFETKASGQRSGFPFLYFSLGILEQNLAWGVIRRGSCESEGATRF